MVAPQTSATGNCRPGLYEIRLKGHLADRWSRRFDGLALTRECDGTTLLRGPLPDQSALHGILNLIRDLGIPLLSVQAVEPD